MFVVINIWKYLLRVMVEVFRSFSLVDKFGKVKLRVFIISLGMFWRLNVKCLNFESYFFERGFEGRNWFGLLRSLFGYLSWDSWERYGIVIGVEWRWWSLSWYCLVIVFVL